MGTPLWFQFFHSSCRYQLVRGSFNDDPHYTKLLLRTGACFSCLLLVVVLYSIFFTFKYNRYIFRWYKIVFPHTVADHDHIGQSNRRSPEKRRRRDEHRKSHCGYLSLQFKQGKTESSNRGEGEGAIFLNIIPDLKRKNG